MKLNSTPSDPTEYHKSDVFEDKQDPWHLSQCMLHCQLSVMSLEAVELR